MICLAIALYGQLLVTGEDFVRYKHDLARSADMTLDKFFQENEDWRPFADLVAYPPLPEELMQEFSDVSSEVLARCMEVVREGGGEVTRGAIYVRIRREKEERGQNADKWATLLCLNQFPGIRTTDTFWAGRKTWVEVYGESYANNVKRNLAKKGINLLPGQEYMPELVRPGYGPHNPDPEAVVSFNNARGYIKSLCEKRGWASEGAVEVKSREPEQDPYENAPAMGEDLIRQKGRQMVEKNPQLRKLPRRELREKVLERFGPSR